MNRDLVARVECWDHAHVFHRKADTSLFDHALAELSAMHKAGAIDGAFIAQVSEKPGFTEVFVDVWRPTRIDDPGDGWLYAPDAAAGHCLPHRYTRVFTPAPTRPVDIAQALRGIVMCPLESEFRQPVLK